VREVQEAAASWHRLHEGRSRTLPARGEAGRDPSGVRELPRAFEAADAAWRDVVKLTFFLRDVAQPGVVRAIRDQYVDVAQSPARSLVEVSHLVHEDFLIEVEAIAAPGA
jgi:hypothetical protein